MIEQHLFHEDGIISNIFAFNGGRIYDRNIEIAQPFGIIGAFYYIVNGVEITFVSDRKGEIWIYCEKGIEMKVHFDDIDNDAEENGIIKIQYEAGNHKIRKANSYNAKVGAIQLYEYMDI